MRPRLHENAQEALQFLALGAGIVLVIRLAIALIVHWSDGPGNELEEAMAPFHNGHPLVDRGSVVLGGLAIIPRLAVALLFTLGCGVLGALLTVPLGRVIGASGIRSAVVGSRVGLLLGGAWAIYCLLCLPPRQTRITADGLALTERPAFLRTVPLPFAARTRRWRPAEMQGFRAGQGQLPEVFLLANDRAIAIARRADTGRHPSEVNNTHAQEAAQLAERLASHFGVPHE